MKRCYMHRLLCKNAYRPVGYYSLEITCFGYKHCAWRLIEVLQLRYPGGASLRDLNLRNNWRVMRICILASFFARGGPSSRPHTSESCSTPYHHIFFRAPATWRPCRRVFLPPSCHRGRSRVTKGFPFRVTRSGKTILASCSEPAVLRSSKDSSCRPRDSEGQEIPRDTSRTRPFCAMAL